jgi:hypothetical protein
VKDLASKSSEKKQVDAEEVVVDPAGGKKMKKSNGGGLPSMIPISKYATGVHHAHSKSIFTTTSLHLQNQASPLLIQHHHHHNVYNH